MPRAVAEAELTDLVLPMDDVAEALAHAVGAPTHSTAASSAPTSHLN
jgi:chemotaxis response regulator CheB